MPTCDWSKEAITRNTCTTTQSNFQKSVLLKLVQLGFSRFAIYIKFMIHPFLNCNRFFSPNDKSSHLWYTCTRENRYVQLFLQKMTRNYYYPVCSRTVKHILDTAVYLYFYREQYKSTSLTLCDLVLIF